MTGMQADAAGIREHIQRVKLGLGKVPHVRTEGLVILPELLPFGFNDFRVINAVHDLSPDPVK